MIASRSRTVQAAAVVIASCIAPAAASGEPVSNDEFFRFLREVTPREGAVEATYVHTNSGWRQINAFDAASRAWYSVIGTGAVGVTPERRLFNGWRGPASIEAGQAARPDRPVGPDGEWVLNFVFLVDVLDRRIAPTSVDRSADGSWEVEFRFPGGVRTKHRPGTSAPGEEASYLPNRLRLDAQGRIERAEFVTDAGTRRVRFEYSPDSPARMPVPLVNKIDENNTYKLESVRFVPVADPASFSVDSVRLAVESVAALDAAEDAKRRPRERAPGTPLPVSSTVVPPDTGAGSGSLRLWLLLIGVLFVALSAFLIRRRSMQLKS